jgi:hypothetical protein
MTIIDEDLSLAIIKYYGVEIKFHTFSNRRRIIDEFGKKGAILARRIDKLLNGLDLKQDWDKYTLESATKWAIEIIYGKHPELSEKALEALVIISTGSGNNNKKL